MNATATLRQAGRYLFYSVATTLVNWLAYSACVALLHAAGLEHGRACVWIANTAAWVVAVTFAFFTNKLRVFRSLDWHPRVWVPELIKFFSTRLAVGLIEIVMVPVFVALGLDRPLFGVDGMCAKIILTPVLILLNYLCGKFLVF